MSYIIQQIAAHCRHLRIKPLHCPAISYLYHKPREGAGSILRQLPRNLRSRYVRKTTVIKRHRSSLQEGSYWLQFATDTKNNLFFRGKKYLKGYMACAIEQNSSYLIILVQVASYVLFLEFSISTVERSREKHSCKNQDKCQPWYRYHGVDSI